MSEKAELSELVARLAHTEEQSNKLQQEAKELRERIKKLEAQQDRAADQETSNKRSASELNRNVGKLIDEVGVIKVVVAQTAQDVEAIKVKLSQQDSQQVQVLTGMVSELKNQLAQLSAAQQRTNNKRELNDFNTNLHGIFSDALQKLKDQPLDKLFSHSLDNLIDAYVTMTNFQIYNFS